MYLNIVEVKIIYSRLPIRYALSELNLSNMHVEGILVSLITGASGESNIFIQYEMFEISIYITIVESAFSLLLSELIHLYTKSVMSCNPLD